MRGGGCGETQKQAGEGSEVSASVTPVAGLPRGAEATPSSISTKVAEGGREVTVLRSA